MFLEFGNLTACVINILHAKGPWPYFLFLGTTLTLCLKCTFISFRLRSWETGKSTREGSLGMVSHAIQV